MIAGQPAVTEALRSVGDRPHCLPRVESRYLIHRIGFHSSGEDMI